MNKEEVNGLTEDLKYLRKVLEIPEYFFERKAIQREIKELLTRINYAECIAIPTDC